jgi:glycosyltransferase involved in cell wall biosynthesis
MAFDAAADKSVPRVSVIIPVFNGAQTISATVESVLAQSFRECEVIVIDDGSTDSTPAILQRFGSRIAVINQSNRGFCAARNAGIARSKCDLIALLDADDVWLPTKLEKSLAVIERSSDIALVYTDVINQDTAGRDLGTSPIDAATAHAPTLDEMLNRLWPIMPSTVVMRRGAWENCGRFAEGYSEDLDFWIRIREQGEFRYLPEKLTRFTVGPLYPKVLRRDNRGELFPRAMRERYGARASGVIRSYTQHKVRILRNTGLAELKKGNRAGARRCLMRSLSYDRTAFKTYMRIARTLLPMSLIRALDRSHDVANKVSR